MGLGARTGTRTVVSQTHRHRHRHLLPIPQKAFPSVVSYDIVGSTTQANAQGFRVQSGTIFKEQEQEEEEEKRAAPHGPSQVFVKQVVYSRCLHTTYVSTKKKGCWPDL
jgi:hypothetical protein